MRKPNWVAVLVAIPLFLPVLPAPARCPEDSGRDLRWIAEFQLYFAGATCTRPGYANWDYDLNRDGCIDLHDYAQFVHGGYLLRGDACQYTENCGVGVNSPGMCRWGMFRHYCADPTVHGVDRRLCELGVFMDGDVSDALGRGKRVPGPLHGAADPSVFLSDRAVAFYDRLGSLWAPDPGPSGDGEGPLYPGHPSGFNIGSSLIWFAPDDNGSDGEDTSFLYVAWDISDRSDPGGCGPVPFDVDGDGSACANSAFVEHSDVDEEFYEVSIQSSANLDGYAADSYNPNGAFVDSDIRATMVLEDPSPLLVQVLPDDQGSLRTDLLARLSDVWLMQVFGVETMQFPTADAIKTNGTGNPNATNRRNACVQQELESCDGACSTGKRCSGMGDAGELCNSHADCQPPQRCVGSPCCSEFGCPACPDGGTCVSDADRNNAELVIKRIESSGLLGPHTGRVCSVSGKPCRSNSQCPMGQTCVSSPILPDSSKAYQNRIAMSRLVSVLRADVDSDCELSCSEELASVAAGGSIPAVEVTARVVPTHADASGNENRATAAPGSFVAVEVVVANLGNAEAAVELSSVLEGVPEMAAVCEVACGRCNVNGAPCVSDADCPKSETCDASTPALEVLLTSPIRGLVDNPVTADNAATLGLNPILFGVSCGDDTGSFLESVTYGGSISLGRLKGYLATRNRACSRSGVPCSVQSDCLPQPQAGNCDPSSQVAEGDRLTLRFYLRASPAVGACGANATRTLSCDYSAGAVARLLDHVRACAGDPDCHGFLTKEACLGGVCVARDLAGVSDTWFEGGKSFCAGDPAPCKSAANCPPGRTCNDGNYATVDAACPPNGVP